jgi:hypothetical protein
LHTAPARNSAVTTCYFIGTIRRKTGDFREGLDNVLHQPGDCLLNSFKARRSVDLFAFMVEPLAIDSRDQSVRQKRYGEASEAPAGESTGNS